MATLTRAPVTAGGGYSGSESDVHAIPRLDDIRARNLADETNTAVAGQGMLELAAAVKGRREAGAARRELAGAFRNRSAEAGGGG